MTRSVVIGTAGHIDHGKSALVKALTGTDPDRLKEEQARGITIDLGFAHLAVGDAAIAFVDVPGHERFVRNMLAGAGGIDAVVLVVAADESVMPQTREHFQICRLLGIERGIVALTKADLVDDDTIELAALEVRELVEGSFLAGAPIVPVSVRTGQGLDELRASLAALAGARPRQARSGVVRLPIDRVFAVKGFGTVVTGTLVSGRVTEGDELALLPEGRAVRIRGLQVHGKKARAADAPRRVALNLGGVDAADLARGATLASPGAASVSRRIDLKLQLLPGVSALKHGTRVRLHHGTSEMPGRVSIAATRAKATDEWQPARPGELGVAVPAGGEAFARIRLERSEVFTRHDRIVMRAYSPAITIGGGLILDPEAAGGGVRRPTALRRFQQLEATASAIDLWLAEAGGRGLEAADLVRRAGLSPERARGTVEELVARGAAITAKDRFFDAGLVAEIEAAVQSALATYHRDRPVDAGMPREALREKVAANSSPELFDIVVHRLAIAGTISGADRVALSEYRASWSPEEVGARDVVEALVRQGGLSPPDSVGLAAAARVSAETLDRLVKWLVRDLRLVRVESLIFHAETLAELKAQIAGLRKGSGVPGGATVDVASFKERYGLSRKFAIPLLEWLDRERVTRRMGEKRVVL